MSEGFWRDPVGPAFSSDTDNWATPSDLFAMLDLAFKFEVDVCATAGNAKCPRYFTPEVDGLRQKWTGTCWCNPPYGRTIGKWLCKAWQSAQSGATVVCLIPARTDTKWWHDYVTKGKVLFWPGRLKFGEGKNSAPFPSAIGVFETAARALALQECFDCKQLFIAERSTAKFCSVGCRVRT